MERHNITVCSYVYRHKLNVDQMSLCPGVAFKFTKDSITTTYVVTLYQEFII